MCAHCRRKAQAPVTVRKCLPILTAGTKGFSWNAARKFCKRSNTWPSGRCGALRFEELRMTARVAAERVQTSRQPFRLNPMSSRERRIVHLALKDMNGIRTESVGVGEERQVVIHPADTKPAK